MSWEGGQLVASDVMSDVMSDAMEQILERYYDEIRRARGHRSPRTRDLARLRAIVRAARNWYSVSGRLNGVLLLNKLLLEECFDPVILEETKGLAGMGTLDEAISEVVRGMNNFAREMRNSSPWLLAVE